MTEQEVTLAAAGVLVLVFAALILRSRQPWRQLVSKTGLPKETCKRALGASLPDCVVVGLALYGCGHLADAERFLLSFEATDNADVVNALLAIELKKTETDYQKAYRLLVSLRKISSNPDLDVRDQIYSNLDVQELDSIFAGGDRDSACAYNLARGLDSSQEKDRVLSLYRESIVDYPQAHLEIAKLYEPETSSPEDIQTAMDNYIAACRIDVPESYTKYENFLGALSVPQLLELALPEERETLIKSLDLSSAKGSEEIGQALSKAGGHFIANIVRKGRGVEYEEALRDVLKARSIKVEKNASLTKREAALIKDQFEQFMNSLSEAERQDFLAKVQKKVEEGKSTYATVGALGATSLAIGTAGFAPYLMATTTMSALSGAVGVTLPFAAYTTLTSTISVLAGPVGWAALLGAVAYAAGRPDKEKVFRGVTAVASIRQRLLYEPIQD